MPDGSAQAQTILEQALDTQRQGRLEEAAEQFELVLLADAQHPEALLHFGILRLSQNRISDAETLLRRAVSVAPGSAEAHAHLGIALQFSQQYEDAVHHFESALACKPTLTEAQFGFAACLQALGRNDQAIELYRRLLEADPALAVASYGLATLFTKLGQTGEAIASYRNAVAADPDFAEAHHGLGLLLARNGDVSGAIGSFRSALEIDPDYDEVRLALAIALRQLECDDEAIECYSEYLARHPGHACAHFDIATIFVRKRPLAEAISHYERALALEPQCAAYMTGLASAFRLVGRPKDAVSFCRRAIALEPDNPDALSLLGRLLVDGGDLEAGLALSRRAFELARHRPDIAYNLVLCGKVAPGDPVVPALAAMLPRAPSFSPSNQCCLYFALAKAYDDIGDPAEAFQNLAIGNSIKRRHVQYDERNEMAVFERIERLFTADMLGRRRGLGYRSEVPVFIVGMPRSGTTLVEQILASHPAVYGAGERGELPGLLRHIAKSGQALAPWPEVLGLLDGPGLCKAGNDYVEALRPLAPEAKRIVDKLPTNFAWAGFINLILPDARIIHLTRDPIDTCLSCYSQFFGGSLNFTYDLGELGRYYRAYSRLMAHWRAVLPQGVMLEIQYESLVANFPKEARRLIDFCGLDWDSACLDFHKTERTVRTASVTQVRQPIYSTSVGRWRPDADALRPLVDGLAH